MDRAAGYALIEMLATLVIIGMMSAMMISGLGASQQVWQRVDSANNMGDTIAGAQILLRERLERVFPATRYDKIPSYADLDGVADKFMFLSFPRDVQAPSAPNASPENLVLLHNVQGLDISYFGVAPPDNKPAWRFAWEGRPSPPQLIRIRVQFPPQDSRVWPELLVKPFAMVDSMCVLIVTTGKCRGRP